MLESLMIPRCYVSSPSHAFSGGGPPVVSLLNSRSLGSSESSSCLFPLSFICDFCTFNPFRAPGIVAGDIGEATPPGRAGALAGLPELVRAGFGVIIGGRGTDKGAPLVLL